MTSHGLTSMRQDRVSLIGPFFNEIETMTMLSMSTSFFNELCYHSGFDWVVTIITPR